MKKPMHTIAVMLMAFSLSSQIFAADYERNLAVSQVSNAASEQRIALVIGNGAYSNAPLKNPVNDAKDMAIKLRGLGFDVIERNDLKTRQIGSTLREFRSKLVPGAVALVFYAGHGLQIKGDNYLPAVDAEINSEEDVPNQSLAVKQIMDVLDESKSRLNLVFLDACRNNPYARSFRSSDRGLARISAPSGTLISYATRPGSVAADGDGRNGLYTSKLLAQMNSNLQIEQALKRVVSDVKAASQGRQEPWMEGSIEGDFCFAGCSASNAAQIASPVPAPARIKGRDEIEQETWESARDSGSIDAIQEYLKHYPKGRFVGQAKVQIAARKAEQVKPVEPVISSGARTDGESDLWTEVQKGNTKDDYDAYLTQHPKGKYAALARIRINKLQEEVSVEAARWDQGAWEAADQSGSEDGYKGYLKGWPDGRYASLAQVRLRKLQADLTARQEQELWQQVQASEDAKTAQSYLDKYPDGRHVAAAQDKLTAIRDAEAEMKPGKVFKDCPGCPEMVVVPAGSFTMGSPSSESGRNADETQRQITIAQDFAAGKFEVTFDEWDACVTAGGCNGYRPFDGYIQGEGWGRGRRPVINVNWDDAKQYVNWLTQMTGKSYRLLTEAEWEYAARSGTNTVYSFGNNESQLGQYAWNFGSGYFSGGNNSNGFTHPVGEK
ncbi:MAG: caspase family protein, partial [Gallionella sp.]